MSIKNGKDVGGRPLGSKNKRTQTLETIADQALARGISPLELMLELMRDYWQRSQKARLSIADRLEFREKAGGWAKESAPFVHPKFTAVKIIGAPEGKPVMGAVVPFKDAIGHKAPPLKKLAAPAP